MRRLVGLIAATALLFGGAGHARADIEIAQLSKPTSVSALDGVVVWSTFRDGRYYLTKYEGGVVSPIPVPPRTVPFDASLGIDSRKHLVVTYSRCATEPGWLGDGPVSDVTAPLPQRGTGRSCVAFVANPDSGQQRRIRRAQIAGFSIFFPTMWGNRVAFAAVKPSAAASPRRSGIPHVYVTDLGGRRALRRIAPGPRGTAGTPSVAGIDLRGRHLAFAWAFSARQHGGGAIAWSQIRLATIPGRSKPKATERADASIVFSPALPDSRTLLFGWRSFTSTQDFGSLVRETLATGHRTSENFPPTAISFAADGSSLFYSTTSNADPGIACGSGSDCGVFLASAPRPPANVSRIGPE